MFHRTVISVRKDFNVIAAGKWVLCIHKDYCDGVFENALISGSKALVERYQVDEVRSSDFARVHKITADINGHRRSMYLKQYLYRSGWDIIKHFFRKSRARRAFDAAILLFSNGFSTPPIIAIAHQRTGLYCSASFLLTEEVTDAQQVFRYFPDIAEGLNNEEMRNKRHLIRSLGACIGRLHGCGIFHGDLRIGNVLARKENQTWRFFFLDNERTRGFRNLPFPFRLKNLVQLNMHRTRGLTNTDRLGFLNAYLEFNPNLVSSRHRLAARVHEKTRQRLACNNGAR
ncbi:MAG: lipopolysaccharide kinase InaA family protein [Planctomycetota bacterium]